MNKQIFFCAITLGLCVAAGLWLEYSSIDWSKSRPANCMPDDCFCEELRLNGIRQPSNTWSNLGFVLVGCLILSAGIIDSSGRNALPKNPITQNRRLANTLGLTIIFMGISSGYYHAALTYNSQWFDVMSIYIFCAFIILYNAVRIKRLGVEFFSVAYVGIIVVLGIILLLAAPARRYLFGGLLSLAAIVETVYYFSNKSRLWGRYIAGAGTLFLTAWIIWWLDLNKTLCSPQSIFQGHALWHLLGAASTGLTYLYYQKEESVE